MDLFTYLMARKGKKILPHKSDLCSYLLATHRIKIKEATGTELNINAKLNNIVSLKMSKESTQDGTPTPENPVEVKTVKGYRNLFDKTTIKTSTRINSTNGTENTNSEFFATDYIELKPNVTYHIKNLKTYGSSVYSFALYNNNKEYVSGYTYNSLSLVDKNDFNISFSDNFTYVRFSFVTETSDLDIAQIVEGDQALPYVPYGTNWIYTKITNGTDTNYYTLPLNGNEIAGMGDYKDEYIVDKNGHCWLNKKTGKVVLNGSETWTVTGTQYTGFFSSYIVLNDMKRQNIYSGDLYSNYFKEHAFTTQEEGVTKSSVPSSFDFAIFRIGNDKAVDLNTWKIWLGTHNTYLYYILKEPTLIDLNYNVDITLFKGVNNISNSDDMDMILKYY